jgi:hypothetical protein
MKKIASLTGIIFFFLLAFSPLAFKKGEKERMNEAIDKILLRLQKNSHRLLRSSKSFPSTNQALDLVDFLLAKKKGFFIPDSSIQEATDNLIRDWYKSKKGHSEADNDNAFIMTCTYDLWALSASQYKPDKTTALLMNDILQRQSENGSWVNPGAVQPTGITPFAATALALGGIQYFKPATVQTAIAESISHANSWLINTVPQSNEDRAFQILGLTWGSANPDFIKQQVKNLLAKQHADGGWSLSDTLQTDPNSTGLSLYVLNQCGNLKTEDSVYQRGLSFLMNNQHEDGSGSWATTALLLAVK